MNFDFSPEQQKFAAEVEQFLDANDDPDVFDLTRENMAQIVDTPKRRAFMARASTNTSSTSSSRGAVARRSARASASSARPSSRTAPRR